MGLGCWRGHVVLVRGSLGLRATLSRSLISCAPGEMSQLPPVFQVSAGWRSRAGGCRMSLPDVFAPFRPGCWVPRWWTALGLSPQWGEWDPVASGHLGSLDSVPHRAYP